MNEIVNLLLSYSNCEFLDERVKIGNQINKLIAKFELGDNDLIFSYDEDGEKIYFEIYRDDEPIVNLNRRLDDKNHKFILLPREY